MPSTAKSLLNSSTTSRPSYSTFARSSSLENGNGVPSPKSRRRGPVISKFRNAIGSVIEDGRREKLKKALQDEVNSHSYESFRKHQAELDRMKRDKVPKKVRQFYQAQNDTLDDWLEVDLIIRHVSDDVVESFDPHDEDGDGVPDPHGGLFDTGESIEPFLPQDERERRQAERKKAGWAVNINVIANILLLTAKIVAVFFSSSLSLIASTVDSALDLLCTLIVWTTTKLVEKRISALNYRFPIGRRRLEPIGILVFSVIMVVSFLQVLQESVKKLLPDASREAATLPATAVGAMGATILVKGIIGLICMRFQTSQVQALVQDCKTDVYFNTLSLAFPFIGHQAGVWWLDPVGAGLLSLYIIYDWAETCLGQVARLTGVQADNRIMKKVLFMCGRFACVVDSFKSVTTYHAGDGVWAEVDIMLPETTALEQSHDVAETLQYCLEGLEEVDRAFVTVDYSVKGPSGHVQT